VADAASSVVSGRPRRYRLLTRLLLLSVLGLVVITRGFWLQGLALPLIFVDQMPDVDAMLLCGGDFRLDEAFRFHQKNPAGQILLVGRSPGRFVRLQILQAPQDLERKELIKRGISTDRIGVVAGLSPDERLSDALVRWFDEHPNAKIIVVCDAFESRTLRWELDRELPRNLSKRLVVRPLASQLYSTANWWHTKRGVAGFIRGWLGLILPVFQRSNDRRWRECNPELFRPAAL